jgi:cytidylate kinase
MALNYYPMIEKVTKLFNFKNLIFQKQQTVPEDAFVRPFITVAREPGAGGAPIAKQLAKLLNFELVDEQIIDQIAASTQKRKSIIKAVDEKSRTNIEDIVHSLLNLEYIDDTTYVTELVRVVLAYAYKGNVVIVGRGANFITPFAKGLHVRVTAPYSVRLQRAMDYEGHSLTRAKAVIAKVEAERRDFVKQYFKHDIAKSNSYDLILNTKYFRINESAKIIIQAFNQKFPKSLFAEVAKW